MFEALEERVPSWKVAPLPKVLYRCKFLAVNGNSSQLTKK